MIEVASPKVVQRYVNGQRIPQPDIMERIAIQTAGAVRANDFYPEYPPAEGREADAA